jgi:hypothetical protein
MTDRPRTKPLEREVKIVAAVVIIGMFMVGLSVLAIVPAAILVRTQRHDRRRAPVTASGAANPVEATT